MPNAVSFESSCGACLLGVLAISQASGVAISIAHAQEVGRSVDELALSYSDFDQRPGSGWRRIAGEGKLLDAAELIDRYEKAKSGLEEWQRVNLRFHAGQMYAFAGNSERALARFEKAYRDEAADSPIRWNAYVGATIAFLKKDRKCLLSFREEIAKGPKVDGRIPNLDVVDRLIENFGESYAVAYGGKPKSQ